MASTSSPTAIDRPLAWDAIMPPAESDNLIGFTLQDTYEIVRLIGEGGMGKVYEAHHTRIRRKRFAIKVLRAEMAYSPEVRTRFQREADAAASINHPNVIAVNDFGYAPDGRPYIVYDYLEGLPLSDFITERKHIEVGIAVYICRQVCRALQAAHDKSVIHRDLKPDNIYLLGATERPDVKVLDFGLSRFMASTTMRNDVTRTGIVMGTPSYMAPEQARAEPTDHRCDIYGVGVLLYASLTGRPPFDEESPQQTVIAVMSQEPTRPRVLAPWIPEQLELVIQRAMARDPAERYQAMAELDVALSPFDVLPQPDAARMGAMRLSRNGGTIEEVDVGSARSQVILLLVLGLVLLLLGLATALAGAPDLLRSRPLSSTEFALIFAAIVGTLLTPFLLFVRWLRGALWNNSLRMVELVPRVRGPLVAGAAVYGTLALLGRALDGFGTQLAVPRIAPGVSGWIGWGPILFGVALIAAIAAFLRRRLLDSSNGTIQRLVAGPIVLGIAIVAGLALLQVGVRLRTPLPVIAEPSAASSPKPKPTVVAPSRAPEPASQQPQVAVPPASNDVIDRAPSELLASAIQKGVDGLLDLREMYPRDPAILEPLAVAYVQRPDGQLPALETLDALFAVAPEKALDKQLQGIAWKAALGPGNIAARALDLMAQRMGKRGADHLYDLYITSPNVRVAARERLDNPRTRENFTPQLGIAYELRTTEGCADKRKLLNRAAKVGDERSVAILQMLSNRTKKGCGYKNRKPCPPPCAEQATEFKAVASAIQKRLAAAATQSAK